MTPARVPEDLGPLLTRGVADIIQREELERLLRSGRPLRLKMGFDPSRPDIHLGHVVGLRKLRQFQELGHQVVLIVGDWTAQIGDPSGSSATRSMLTAAEVRANAETYLRQFFQVVDKERTEVAWQSQWFGPFTLADVIKLTSRFTVAQMLAREDFAARFKAGRPLAVTELLYPLHQAHDTVMVRADVEFGGTDQRFNLLVGRELQAMMGQTPQQCLLMPLLVGTDGQQKMSKSLGNYIAVEDAPHDFYGKVMSLPDALMLDYYTLLTDVPDAELAQLRADLAVGQAHPMEAKKRLARLLVAQFHGEPAVGEAQAHFEAAVQRREAPEEIEERGLFFEKVVNEAVFANPRVVMGGGSSLNPDGTETRHMYVPLSFILVYLGMAPSRTEARRLIKQGAVEVDGRSVNVDEVIEVRDGSLIRVGKRRWVRVRDAQS
ncbi:MAG: tyrosine--tRNA ligase [Chloroflexi bacterium]|nr:tyrosine--tRNA ligase [Chloroflexota bacterium]